MVEVEEADVVFAAGMDGALVGKDTDMVPVGIKDIPDITCHILLDILVGGEVLEWALAEAGVMAPAGGCLPIHQLALIRFQHPPGILPHK